MTRQQEELEIYEGCKNIKINSTIYLRIGKDENILMANVTNVSEKTITLDIYSNIMNWIKILKKDEEGDNWELIEVVQDGVEKNNKLAPKE